MAQQLPAYRGGGRIEPKDPKGLLRPVDVPGRDRSSPAAGMTESLPGGQVRLASPKLVLEELAIRDVPVDHVLADLSPGNNDGARDERYMHSLAILGAPDRLSFDPFAALGGASSELPSFGAQFGGHHQVV